MKTSQTQMYMFLEDRLHSFRCSLHRGTHVVLLGTVATLLIFSSNAHAVVKIFDGFGDGDVDNNGTAFESHDVVGTYEPFLDDVTMLHEDSPLIYAPLTMVNAPTVADDPTDTGIRWFSSGGFGSSGTSVAASRARIIDDSAGALPETVDNQGFLNTIPTPNETQFIPALDNGLALSVESKGRGRSLSGFFETDHDYGNGKQGTIQLGPNVDDEVKLSFDFRVWMSAENYNDAATNHVPDFGQVRFGLFQDTEDQLGDVNDFAGTEFSPAEWGAEDGLFRGDLVGSDATDDHGWYVRMPLQDADSMAPPFTIGADGADARINEERNDLGTGERFLQGMDNQTVALPDQVEPDFVNLETTKRYHVEFSLRRFDEVGGSTDPNDPGDNIEATFTVTNLDDALETFSLSGFDSLVDLGELDPGFDSDSWDYFSIALAGESDSNELDFIIDNFMIEVEGSNAGIDGDFDGDNDVDGADFLVWQRTLGDAPNLALWQANYGTDASLAAAVGAVPEPSSMVLLFGFGASVALRRNRLRRV